VICSYHRKFDKYKKRVLSPAPEESPVNNFLQESTCCLQRVNTVAWSIYLHFLTVSDVEFRAIIFRKSKPTWKQQGMWGHVDSAGTEAFCG
jgi:hypothetical protein